LKNTNLKKLNLRREGNYLSDNLETARSNILKGDNRYNENYVLDSILGEVKGSIRRKQKVSINANKEIALWNILIPFDYVGA